MQCALHPNFNPVFSKCFVPGILRANHPFSPPANLPRIKVSCLFFHPVCCGKERDRMGRPGVPPPPPYCHRDRRPAKQRDAALRGDGTEGGQPPEARQPHLPRPPPCHPTPTPAVCEDVLWQKGTPVFLVIRKLSLFQVFSFHPHTAQPSSYVGCDPPQKCLTPEFGTPPE